MLYFAIILFKKMNVNILPFH